MPELPETPKPEPLFEAEPKRLHPLLRPIISCTVALGIAILLAPLVLKKPATKQPEPAESVNISQSDIAMAVLAPTRKLGVVEGKLIASNALDVPSPASGMVARILVKQGSSVKKGESILELSIGNVTSRPAPAVERMQNKAEQSQVLAVRRQDEMVAKLADARERLSQADADVAEADQRLQSARELLAGLKAGKAVVPPAPARPRRDSPSAADRAALKAAQRAQQDAEAAEQQLFAAQDKVRSTEAAARTATEELARASSRVSKVEDLYNRKVMSASDVDTARTAALEAQDKATEATNAAFVAKQDAQRQEKNVKNLRAAADKAAKKVAGGLSNVQVFDAPDPTPAPSDTGTISLAQASKMIQEALAQGRAAAQKVERLHAEIEGYESQVDKTNSRVTNSTKQLEAAQQRVMDSVPKPTFVSVQAPQDGRITWLPTLAQEVKQGQPVCGLAEGGLMGHLEDTTGWWRRIAPGSILPATVPPATPPLGATGASGQPGNATGASVTMTVTRVLPSKEEKPGVLEGPIQVVTLGDPPIQIRPGMKLNALKITGSTAPTLQVPESCVLEKDGVAYVAVLSENRALGMKNREFTARWRIVSLGEKKNGRADIAQGLQPGDRVLRGLEKLPPPSTGTDSVTAIMKS